MLLVTVAFPTHLKKLPQCERTWPYVFCLHGVQRILELKNIGLWDSKTEKSVVFFDTRKRFWLIHVSILTPFLLLIDSQLVYCLVSFAQARLAAAAKMVIPQSYFSLIFWQHCVKKIGNLNYSLKPLEYSILNKKSFFQYLFLNRFYNLSILSTVSAMTHLSDFLQWSGFLFELQFRLVQVITKVVAGSDQ